MPRVRLDSGCGQIDAVGQLFGQIVRKCFKMNGLRNNRCSVRSNPVKLGQTAFKAGELRSLVASLRLGVFALMFPASEETQSRRGAKAQRESRFWNSGWTSRNKKARVATPKAFGACAFCAFWRLFSPMCWASHQSNRCQSSTAGNSHASTLN